MSPRRARAEEEREDVEEPQLSMGSTSAVSSTYISTVTKTGRRRQTKLEDLDVDELENYSADVMEMSRKKKINKNNAFDCKVIDCASELLRRTSSSQATQSSIQAETLKYHSQLLETCGTVYSLRVDNVYQFAKDLTEELERASNGKKARSSKTESNANTEEGVTEEDDEDEAEKGKRLVVAAKKKKNKGPRRNRTVEDPRELACSETDVNSNLISRYWSLIGNVQPGVMKDSWLHDGERMESGHNFTFVLDPDMTCVQRYENMNPNVAGFSQSTFSAEELKFTKEEEQQALEKINNFALQLGLGNRTKRASIDSCIGLNKKQIQNLRRTADEISTQEKRYKIKMLAGDVQQEFLELCSSNLEAVSDDAHELEPLIALEDMDFGGDDNHDATSGVETSSGDLVMAETEEQYNRSSDRISRASYQNSTAEDQNCTHTLVTGIPSEVTADGFVIPKVPLVSRAGRASSVASIRSKNGRSSRYGSVLQENDENSAVKSLSVESTGNLKKKRKLSDITWPDSLRFSPEARGAIYGNLDFRTSISTFTKKRKTDTLLQVSLFHNVFTAMSGLDVLQPNRLRNTLQAHAKTLQRNIEGNWLEIAKPDLLFSKEQLSETLRKIFDDEYDPDAERLQRIWAKQPTDVDYSISSDESDAGEDFHDAVDDLTDFPDEPNVKKSPVPDDVNFPALDGESLHNVESTTRVINDGWMEEVDVPAEQKYCDPDVAAKLKRGLEIHLAGNSPDNPIFLCEDEDAERAFAFAENIALRDCTGSGVDIRKMKHGVLNTYNLLCKWRKKLIERSKSLDRRVAGPSSSRDTSVPYLTNGDILDNLRPNLKRIHWRHINPSIVFSCLLHLAYERKLELCNSENLNEMYVMTSEEFESYSRDHPHLNKLNDHYCKSLLRMEMTSGVSCYSAMGGISPGENLSDSEESDLEVDLESGANNTFSPVRS